MGKVGWVNVGLVGLLMVAQIGMMEGAIAQQNTNVEKGRSGNNYLSIDSKIDEKSDKTDNGKRFNIHTFEAKAGQKITIEVTSPDFAPSVVVMNSEKQEVASDWGYRNFKLPVFLEIPRDGLYIVVIVVKPGSPLGNYQLISRSSTQTDFELAEAEQLNQQVLQLRSEGKYQTGVPLAEKALQIRQRILGDRHPAVATSLNNLAGLYQSQGRYDKAEPLYLQALELLKSLLGDRHPAVATSLNNLAALYRNQGRYDKAEPLYLQAFELRKSLLGEHHPDVASSLNNLAGLYDRQGRYDKAEPLYIQALELFKSLLGERHPAVATSLNNLAALYDSQGRYDKAEPLYIQALELSKSLLGDRHPDVANSLNNLAALYKSQGRYDKAEPLYVQALELFKSLLGERHPSVATSLNNLAALYQSQGRYDKAEPLFIQALELRKSLLGERHPSVATSLNNLAALYQSQGRYDKAEPLFIQALELRKSLLGDRHPDVASSLNNLATLYQSQGRYDNAIALLNQGLTIEETNLSTHLAFGAEDQKQDYIAQLSGTTDGAISLHLQAQPTNPQAAQLALTTLFRRKGRILDATSLSLASLRQNLTPENQTLLNQLADRTSQLAALPYSPLLRTDPTTYRQQLQTLTQQVSDLQADLARRSATYRQQTQPITLDAIQQQIPPNTTLLEITRYKPFNPKAKESEQVGKPRYAAYLLTRDGTLTAIDLGEAAPIDQLTAEFRDALQRPTTNPTEIARQLDAALMQPIRAKLNPTHKTLLISPDSHLNLIPFAALVDENNRYLVETLNISYLTSGRDLLRLPSPNTKPDSKPSAPLLLANPDYTIASASSSPSPRPTGEGPGVRAAADLRSLSFDPLPGTAEEAKAIAPKLPGVTLLTASQATETALKQTPAPRILHIATHGFFLADLPQPKLDNSRSLFASRSFSEPRAGARPDVPVAIPVARPYNPNDNPLLRSGLALAGANRLNGGNPNSDGILTALEASQLNLRGTELVILSACETALGDVTNGEGVYGLRRAFTLAGAQTQMISLWKVSDEGTKDLMVKYYDRLLAGTGRNQALLDTQRELLNTPQYQHPYYWASFILSGNWQPLPKTP
ncbi:CHAT domain-containing tetratricopeptide repeat protein [Alkalinema sp. FACHB-956]|uniref:CHAT domain-containing tetratricopeptide repeat protein n=1 Tax=Alkalinema sp. FACHB-956 TaxID=2692768 RepID=UPI0016832945|nr:CHAT domain-containing tetratricopeptide repeat protein [Alkalinema sp. FACHB-956]MBD2327997.1 CHAT domain-containing protein [Alkalinema sp. FACHB-956]